MAHIDLCATGLAMRRMSHDELERVLQRATAESENADLPPWGRALAGMVAAAATARLDTGIDPTRVLGFFDSILDDFRHLDGAPSPDHSSAGAALVPDLDPERTPTT